MTYNLLVFTVFAFKFKIVNKLNFFLCFNYIVNKITDYENICQRVVLIKIINISEKKNKKIYELCV